MSLTRIDQQQTSSVRRSSLVVNLSTTKKRSSVTTLTTTSSSSSVSGSKNFDEYFKFPTSKLGNKFAAESGGEQQAGREQLDNERPSAFNRLRHGGQSCSNNSVPACPQSAPATLNKPEYCTRNSSSSSTIVDESQAATEYHECGAERDSHATQSNRLKTTNNCTEQPTMQVIEVSSEIGPNHHQHQETTSVTKSAEQSKETSPEPIVVVKHTSSSSNSNSSSSNNNSSDELSSTKLVRRRTVRRYHRAAVEQKEESSSGQQNSNHNSRLITNNESGKAESAEVIISINRAATRYSDDNNEDARNRNHEEQHVSYPCEKVRQPAFRTRQITYHIGQQNRQQQEQQQTASSLKDRQRQTETLSSSSSSLSSTTSKTASKISTISSRKSTSHTTESRHHQQLISETTSSSSLSSSSRKQQQAASSTLSSDKTTTMGTRGGTSPQARLELRLSSSRGHSPDADDLFERSNGGGSSLARSSKKEESSSSVRRSRHQSTITSSTSTSNSNSLLRDGSLRRKAAAASTVSSEAATSLLQHSSSLSRHEQLTGGAPGSSHHLSTSSSSSKRVESSSASLVLSNSHNHPDGSTARGFLYPDTLFSSPTVRSLVKEIGCEFAELENALCSSSQPLGGVHVLKSGREPVQRASLSTRLFGHHTRPLSPVGSSQLQALTSSGSGDTVRDAAPDTTDSCSSSVWHRTGSSRQVSPDSWSLKRESRIEPQAAGNERSSSERIRDLMSKAQTHSPSSTSSQQHHQLGSTDASNSKRLSAASITSIGRRQHLSPVGSSSEILARKSSSERSSSPLSAAVPLSSLNVESAASAEVANNLPVTVSIERIDQRMSGICEKLNECHDTKEAIDLLKIMIQMIEKAWSVPVCGDDLGFKLCNSLREAGGLDIILGFIHESDFIIGEANAKSKPISDKLGPTDAAKISVQQAPGNSVVQAKNNGGSNPALRLNLSKIGQLAATTESSNHDSSPPARGLQHSPAIKQMITTTKDSDSDILTSDLGLDSTSVESLSYASAASPTGAPEALPTATDPAPPSVKTTTSPAETLNQPEPSEETLELATSDAKLAKEQEEACLRKEELVFLSAQLLSQCLTSENRDYIVAYGLDQVIKLACNFTTMKSTQSKRLLSRSVLMRQSSTISSNNAKQAAEQEPISVSDPQPAAMDLDRTDKAAPPEQQVVITENKKDAASPGSSEVAAATPVPPCGEHSDTHAIIGTEILQHLFKHSEHTCSRMISLGGLEAILYGCRSSNIETLRHCASALANLALYGGPDSQQTMIEQKAHVWLFPLAFNEDDNIQYYACLAIVVLVANQEIEADVLKSSTLNLVEPFVLGHEPQKFAESTTAHIHGQSAEWLRKLVPLLESKREEARNLACFHFAMEAHIKREQGRTKLFAEIGAIEPLRKVGSSPLAIASKFACQALRLIGEKEPHKLSQQVPLWTSDDVCEWVSQIGFERFKGAFVESRVDGDLLLQLDEEMLRSDIQIDNGIIRRRFLRELSNLKRIADYSSVDKSNLSALFSGGGCGGNSSGSQDFVRQYIYPMVQLGVTRDNIHLFDCEQLLAECKVTNTIHRLKMAHAIKELQERIASEVASIERMSPNGADQKTLDVFVSYRRSTGSQLASLLKVHLQLRGFTVFIDVERLEAGKFDNNLLDSIKAAKNFILVLSPNALDRCIGDQERKDWVHKEIVAALASDCNIIPIIDNFHWPDVEQLPEDMRSIAHFNGVRWIHDYQDACVDKVERFIRGELLNNWATISSASSTGAGGGGSLQRMPPVGSVSTPSIVATPSISSAGGGGGGGNQSSYSMRPMFDADHHPLSTPFASAYHLQHSSPSSSTLRR